MRPSGYGKTLCPICGEAVTKGGAGNHSHMMKHVRHGEARIETRTLGERFVFVKQERQPSALDFQENVAVLRVLRRVKKRAAAVPADGLAEGPAHAGERNR